MANFLIPGGIAACTLALGFMGFQVTVHPPQTDISKRIWKSAFALISVVAFALIFFQWKRAEDADNRLEATINSIQQNTSKPPVINVEPPAVAVIPPPAQKQQAHISFLDPVVYQKAGSILEARYQCKNDSAFPARNVVCHADVLLAPMTDGRVGENGEDHWYKYFEEHPFLSPDSKRAIMEPGAALGVTAEGEELSTEVEKELSAGGMTIMVTGFVTFSDDSGTHRTELCRWLEPPANGIQPAWHDCHHHQGMLY